MQINTQRLTLEPLGIKHLDSTHVYASDPELTKYMMFLPVEDISETERYLAKCENEMTKSEPAFYELAVLLDRKHIGSVSAYLEENGSAWELGWIISQEFHGNGYAAEAAAALMNFCCEATPVRRFIAHCDSENIPSQQVMKKLGMSLAGECSGRKNRGSDEIRREMLFELKHG